MRNQEHARVIAPSVVVAVLLYNGCDDRQGPQTPPDALPNIKNILDDLRDAKAYPEDSAAKVRRFLPRRLAVGEQLYEEARQAYSNSINGMRDSLMLPKGTVTSDQLNALMSHAEETYETFHNWCRQGSAEVQSAGGGAFVDASISLLSLLVDLQKIQDAREQEQRAYFLEELEKCKWSSWNDVRR
jgi:hypothetical protein